MKKNMNTLHSVSNLTEFYEYVEHLSVHVFDCRQNTEDSIEICEEICDKREKKSFFHFDSEIRLRWWNSDF